MTNRTNLLLWSVASLTFLVVGSVDAQAPIGADRPGLDFSPTAVSPGVFQVELGLPTVITDNEDETSTRVIAFPALVRVGIVETIEARIGASPIAFTRDRVGETVTEESGFADLLFGFKWSIRDGADGGPGVALVPEFIIPVGPTPASAGDPTYLTALSAAWPLADLTLSTVGAFALSFDEDDWSASGLLAGVLGGSIGDGLGLFGELAYVPAERAADGFVLGGGLTWLPSNEVQLDGFVDGDNSARLR